MSDKKVDCYCDTCGAGLIIDYENTTTEYRGIPNYKYESFEEWYETILITDHIVLYREAFEAARETKERKG